MNTQKTGYKKRIKQKSLSAIFAKKLKETNAVIRNVQQPQISSQSKGVTAKAARPEKIEQSEVPTKKNVKFDKIPSTTNSDSTNEPILSFTKATKAHTGKILLAKKRDDSMSKLKRSLSDIFSNPKHQNESDTRNLIQKHDIPKNNVKLDNESKVVAKKSPILKRTDILNKKEKRKHREKIVNIDRDSDKTPKLMHRAGGKISSLFGNNPDVPTIGQRLVKPVNEPIFTKITFADLNIHPFMVSSCV